MTEMTLQTFADLCSFYGALGTVSAVLHDLISEAQPDSPCLTPLRNIADELDELRSDVQQQAEGQSREMSA